jgi:molecular chaperone GrpE (heat shock protein)
MENSNAFSETANVVTSFLPIYDELMALRDMYQEDDYGKQYTGLTGAMNTAFKALGVEEVTVEVGTTTDEGKVTVVSEEHSKDYPKGTILRTGKVGLELKGNILRLPEVVVSLGAAEAGTGFGA